MPTWEETKRNMQMAFLDAAKDIHSSIGNAYQQIMTTGHLYPPMGKENFTQQIIQDKFPEPEMEQQEKEPLFYLNHFHGHDPEQDQGLEPDR
ncbi:MAG TPA: hypothetical protein VKY19_14110 [Ktedonosporobacter sp.]|jgi:hypothetical protein|nr:hypothetical protein [Ktedonosporobacter sp.]